MDANVVDEYEEIENFNNVINIDGTQAIFLNGQYYIPANTKAILLPDSDSQYVINDTGDILLDANFETSFDNSGTVQYVENTHVKLEDQNQVVYYTKGVEEPIEMNDDECSQGVQYGFMDNINIDSVLENINKITEDGQNEEVQNYQYILQLENNHALGSNPDSSMNTVQRNYFDASILESVDISKITGKNLLTGQTVTLDSYLQKVKNINNELTLEKAEKISENIRKRSQHTALSNLLNKKLTIGKTLTGQRLVGKVIHVGKKEAYLANDSESLIYEPTLTNEENIDGEVEDLEEYTIVSSIFSLITDQPNEILGTVILEDNQTNDTAILMDNRNDTSNVIKPKDEPEDSNNEETCIVEEPKLHQVNQSMVAYVSRTLINLMSMESVSKKLKRKNLLIKIIEKIIIGNDKAKMNVYQMRGHLEMLGGWEERGYEEKWIFKLDKDDVDSGNRSRNQNSKKFPETMRLTISIVLVDGIIQSTKVNLNYCQEKCSLCSKEFRTIYKLKSHLKLVHQIAESQFYCQLCDKSLEDKDMFTQHRQYHVERKELFPCTKCDSHFLTGLKMAKHMLSHDPTGGINLKCTICGEVCTKVSTWRKHMLIHNAERPYWCSLCNKQFFTLGDLNSHARTHNPKNCYVCKVCNRTFSRYSNLQRHSEIHGTKNSRSAYSCSMCGCTYNYVSSLTRHIVQNHISAS